MIPIVATLLKAGLSTAAGAILAKGEEWFKEKTGLDVNAASLEDIRQAEVDHEEDLRAAELEYRSKELETELAAVTVVNSTMVAESQSEKWPQYSWRPAIGFSVAWFVALIGTVIAFAFAAVIVFNKSAEPLKYIPEMLTAAAAFMAIVTPILGVAAWFRGKTQLEGTKK